MSSIFTRIHLSLITLYSIFQTVSAESTFLRSFPPVEIKNLYNNGPIINKFFNKFDDQDLEDESLNIIFRSIEITSFDNCLASAYFEDFKDFYEVVLSAMKCIEKNAYIQKKNKTRNVINNIYNAACYLKATKNELIVFTAIALHNVYSFYKFPEPNTKENESSINDNRSRGLLQITSKSYYKNLNDISLCCNNYLKKPYLLDEFSKDSILDEFLLFQKKFYPKSYKKIDAMEKIYESTIVRMGSNEAKLLTSCFVMECLEIQQTKGKEVLKDLLEKLKRREKILFCLLAASTRKNNSKSIIINLETHENY